MVEFRIDPTRASRLLLGVALALLAAHLAGLISRFYFGHDYVRGLVPLFDFVVEANLPTWFSSIILAIASMLLALITGTERAVGGRFVRHWAVLSVVFAVLSLDEIAQLHEKMMAPSREFFGASGLLYFAWVIPAGFFVLILGAVYFRWLIALPRHTRRLFVVAALVFIGGALGLELFEGQLSESGRYFDATYMVLVTIEESAEMLGVIVFVYALAQYLASKQVCVILGKSSSQ